MDPMLMAIIAGVVIVILVGFFIMKSRGKSNTPAIGEDVSPASPQKPSKQPSNRPKTLAEQQRELNAVPAAPTQPEVDSLLVAQQFFDQKDYAGAANHLQSAITKQPNRADLQLLLLKTYAEQKNYEGFNSTYTTLTTLNDPSASSQAASLKHLLDEEQAQALGKPMSVAPVMATVAAAAVAVPAAAAVVPDSMDFDNFSFDVEPEKPAPAVTQTPTSAAPAGDSFNLEDDAFSFDDLETPTTPAPAVTQHTANNVASEDSFDLSFDDFDISTATSTPAVAPASPTPQTSTDTSLEFDDFDMGLETATSASVTPPVVVPPAATPSVTVDEPALEFDDFGDDFNLDALDLSANKTAPTLAPVLETVTPAPEPMPVASVTPAVVTPVAEEEDFDFDFSGNMDTTPPKTLVDTAVTAHDGLAASSPAIAPASPSVESIAEFDDFDLSFDTEPSVAEAIKTTPEPAIPTIAPTLSDDDFSFDIDTAIAKESSTGAMPVIDTPAVTTATPVAENLLDDNFDFDISQDAESHPTSVAIEPTAQPILDMTSATPAVVAESHAHAIDSHVADSHFADNNDTLDQLDALYAQDVAHEISTPAPIVTPDLGTGTHTDLAPIAAMADVATPSTVAPAPLNTEVASTGEVNGTALSNAFAFIKDIDSTQLNLDLAEQYIELGEYDSAKRLLNEISHANPTQQSMVTGLLEKIG